MTRESDFMALIGRLFVILFGFLAACLVAGMIVVGAVLFPEFSEFSDGSRSTRARSTSCSVSVSSSSAALRCCRRRSWF